VSSAAEARTQERDALVERLFQAALGFQDICGVYLGHRLGLYDALGNVDGATPAELADRTACDERYVREWLEQQAVTGILAVESEDGESERRYAIPDGHAEALLERDSVNWIVPLALQMIGSARPLGQLLAAYRSGAGVPYTAYGPDMREGISLMNRGQFLNYLGSEWLPAMPDVHARLSAAPPARVADVACGTGWSSIAIARACPTVRVDGIDLDSASIEAAHANAVTARVSDRVSFAVRDAADPALGGRYDVVTVFEALHDMARPVDALRAIRGLLADGGTALVADERVAEAFTARGDETERLMYGFSILHCLPVGRAEQPSAATGTVLRPSALRAMANEAGFGDVEILPIDNDFWRFYRLNPTA
jgi:2-polyprenyl-3-methyl-5-hydroxy-6-metoxy-1,4-benzoquinol methylase